MSPPKKTEWVRVWEEAEGRGEATDQLDQRVLARSKGLRAEMCWQGRQEMRAVTVGALLWEEGG